MSGSNLSPQQRKVLTTLRDLGGRTTMGHLLTMLHGWSELTGPVPHREREVARVSLSRTVRRLRQRGLVSSRDPRGHVSLPVMAEAHH